MDTSDEGIEKEADQIVDLIRRRNFMGHFYRGSELAEQFRSIRDAERARFVEDMWINHGCSMDALYGDDGEMQCGNCVIDFKRMPLLAIFKRLAILSEGRERARCTGILEPYRHKCDESCGHDCEHYEDIATAIEGKERG